MTAPKRTTKAPTKRKPPAKKTARAKPPRKGKKRGPPAVHEVVSKALDEQLTAQMQRTAMAVFGQIATKAEAGEDIPIPLLGAARLCAEWHTDYLTVQSALVDEVP